MLREIDSRTSSPPQICQIWVLGTPVACLIHQSEALPSYIYTFIDLSALDLNCTICKYFSDYVRSLFLITKFAIDASNSHLNSIAYSVVAFRATSCLCQRS